jgi:hypothetical protein
MLTYAHVCSRMLTYAHVCRGIRHPSDYERGCSRMLTYAHVSSRMPDTSDYEEWVPADALREGGCLMGRKVMYTRRKREVQCFNGYC